jgi:hypothetical protein
VVAAEPRRAVDRFLVVLRLAGALLWRLCFLWPLRLDLFDEWRCLVLPFDGCLEPGVGDELVGCLCGRPGPVVVVVVGVVLVVLGPVVVVPVVGVVGVVMVVVGVVGVVVEVVGVVDVVVVVVVVGVVGVVVVDVLVVVVGAAALVVVVLVVVVVVVVDPAVVVEVEELIDDEVVAVDELELVAIGVIRAEQPPTTLRTALGFGNPGAGSSAARAEPSVGTGSLARGRLGGRNRDHPQTQRHGHRHQRRERCGQAATAGHGFRSFICIGERFPRALPRSSQDTPCT